MHCPRTLLHRALQLGRALLAPSLLGCGLLGCRTESDAAPGASTRRVLVIGWDGASWSHLDPLLARGRLPSLEALLARGSEARLESTRVPISSAAWVGATTGVHPGKSGVYDFFEPVPSSYDVGLISARSNRADPLWRILTRRGIVSHVVGVPVTYPPEPILGSLVAGMLAPRDAEFAWPPELALRLRAEGFEPDLGTWLDEDELDWERVLSELEKKRALLLELLGRSDWRFAMFVFKELDVLLHRAYGGDRASFVAPLYERLDGILGDLVAAVGEDTDVILLSDHGFADYDLGFNLHAWLVEAGFAERRSDTASSDAPRGPLATRRPLERRVRMAQLELSRSRAFALVGEGNFGALRLNVVGREPEGCVGADEVEATLERLEAALRAVDLEEGTPLVVDTWRGAELYPGREARVVPDLVFEVHPEVQVALRDGGPVFARYARSISDHALIGVFAAAGPDFDAGSERGDVSIFDLAPTVLRLLGLPVYAEMDGRARGRVLEAARGVRRIPASEDPGRVHVPKESGEPFTAAEIEELERALEALGYGG